MSTKRLGFFKLFWPWGLFFFPFVGPLLSRPHYFTNSSTSKESCLVCALALSCLLLFVVTVIFGLSLILLRKRVNTATGGHHLLTLS